MKRFFQILFKMISRLFILTLGAVIAAIGLEIFLIPNDVIDGGITGISIILGHITHQKIGFFLFGLNLPFLLLAYRQFGKTFTLSSFYAITILSIMVTILHPVPGLTQDILLATVFGGIILGIGVGIVIRYGGAMDGTEMLSIMIERKSSFSVGEIILFFNVFILSAAGFVFGWDRAMYSLIAYFIAFKMIDMTIDGFNENKSVMIISDKADNIAQALTLQMGRGVTFFEGTGGFSNQPRKMIYTIISRLEISKFKTIAKEIDDRAFITISDIQEVIGGKAPTQKIK